MQQYVPIESVEPANDISMEGWTSCDAFTAANQATYASAAWTSRAAAAAPALASLQGLVGARNASLINAYNMFDYINVQYIHNASFLATCSPSQLGTARDLANFHEYDLFSGGAIDQIAITTMVPWILGGSGTQAGLSTFANASSPVKFIHLGGASLQEDELTPQPRTSRSSHSST